MTMTVKADDWRERLAAWRASGLSIAAFCRDSGVPYAQFMYWQRRLAARQTGLVPVQVAALSVSALSLELTLANGLLLHVKGAAVADVVTLVRGLSC